MGVHDILGMLGFPICEALMQHSDCLKYRRRMHLFFITLAKYSFTDCCKFFYSTFFFLVFNIIFLVHTSITQKVILAVKQTQFDYNRHFNKMALITTKISYGNDCYINCIISSTVAICSIVQ